MNNFKGFLPYALGGLCGIVAYHVQKHFSREKKAIETHPHPDSYEVKYWNSRGRAEQVRLMLAECNVIWVDVDETNYQTTFFQQLPVLYELYPDRKVEIPQSITILRHLARVYGFYGKNEVERTRIDYLSDGVTDWRVAFSPAGGYPAFGTNAEENGKYLPGTFTKYGEIYEKVLEHSSSGYLVGEGISYVDVQLLALLHEHLEVFATCLDKFPFLRKFVAKMEKRPSIQTYLSSPARHPPDNKQ